MSNYRIKMDRSDDKFNARVMDVTIGIKHFRTPSKALSSSFNGELCEIYQNIDEKTLENSRFKDTVLDRLPSRCKKGNINIVIPNYTDVSIKDEALCNMENRIHTNTDIVVVPKWSGVLSVNNDSMLSDNLWDLSRRYIEEVRRLNGKLIMGNIPLKRPQSVIDKLINGYIKLDVTSFLLDYEGCQAMGKAHLVRDISKKVSEYSEESLLHSVNMRKSHDYKDMKPADDFLSFMNGVDILGNNHMKGGGGNNEHAKVFNSFNWTYIDRPTNGRSFKEIAERNHKMINMEAEIVRREICEKGSVIQLVKTKPGAAEYAPSYSQTTLNLGDIH